MGIVLPEYISWWMLYETQVLAPVDLPVIADKYREFLKEQNG